MMGYVFVVISIGFIIGFGIGGFIVDYGVCMLFFFVVGIVFIVVIFLVFMLKELLIKEECV